MTLPVEPFKFERVLWAAAVIFFILLYAVYYPPIFAFRDESTYLSMAYVYRAGSLFIEKTGIPVDSFVAAGKHWVNGYQPAVSVILMLLTLPGWQWGFLLGPLFHLTGGFIFLKFLRFGGIKDPFWAILYLFFPAFVFFSRTLMSDIPCAVVYLAGAYFYYSASGRHAPYRAFCGGLLLGLSLFFRITNLIAVLPFLIFAGLALVNAEKRPNALALLGGFSVFAVLTGVWNYVNFGSPFILGRSSAFNGVINFSSAYISENARHYLPSLLLVYPGMLAAPFLVSKTRKPEMLLACIFLPLFYGLYYFHDRLPQPLATCVLGTRFLFPVIPFFLLAYAGAGETLLRRLSVKGQRIVKAGTLFFLVLSALALSHFHQRALSGQKALKEAVYGNTKSGDILVYDYNASELIQSVWGDRIYIRFNTPSALFQKLQHANRHSGIYLVKRDPVYAGAVMPGISPEDFVVIRSRFETEEVLRRAGLEIYRLTPKSD